jgi:hypothetical protein
MRRGTALADRKETEFATLSERIFVAIESHRHARRSMDYELKEFRNRGVCIRPVFMELLDEVGWCLWGLMYAFLTEQNPDQKAGELLELLRRWRGGYCQNAYQVQESA